MIVGGETEWRDKESGEREKKRYKQYKNKSIIACNNENKTSHPSSGETWKMFPVDIHPSK